MTGMPGGVVVNEEGELGGIDGSHYPDHPSPTTLQPTRNPTRLDQGTVCTVPQYYTLRNLVFSPSNENTHYSKTVNEHEHEPSIKVLDLLYGDLKLL